MYLLTDQAAAGSIVRGLGKQKLGAIGNVFGYYAVGFPIGVSLMFAAKMGIFGRKKDRHAYSLHSSVSLVHLDFVNPASPFCSRSLDRPFNLRFPSVHLLHYSSCEAELGKSSGGGEKGTLRCYLVKFYCFFLCNRDDNSTVKQIPPGSIKGSNSHRRSSEPECRSGKRMVRTCLAVQ